MDKIKEILDTKISHNTVIMFMVILISIGTLFVLIGAREKEKVFKSKIYGISKQALQKGVSVDSLINK